MKIRNLVELFSMLPEDERIIVDVLRQIIIETLPEYCKEKISYNVPFFYGHKGICIIWPSTVPRGGIKKGVLLGFWYGNKLNDRDGFLSRGTNKQIFYKIYHTPEEIDEKPIRKLLKEAIKLDSTFRTVLKAPPVHTIYSPAEAEAEAEAGPNSSSGLLNSFSPRRSFATITPSGPMSTLEGMERISTAIAIAQPVILPAGV